TDPGVPAPPAVVRLGHEDPLVHGHHAPRLAQDHLDEPRVLGEPGGHCDGDRRGLDVAEPDQAALGLRHDLLTDHEEVARLHGRRLARRGLDHEAADVVAAAYFADPGDADDFVAGHCSGVREAGLFRGWPDTDAAWLRHARSTRPAWRQHPRSCPCSTYFTGVRSARVVLARTGRVL